MIECVLGLTVDIARVAQRIERLPPEQKATGSNPVAGTTDSSSEAGPFRGLASLGFIVWASVTQCPSAFSFW